jgi:membrane fusion protein, multidrug efflux system
MPLLTIRKLALGFSLGLVGLTLAGCVEEEAPTEVEARPVRTITIAEQLVGETVTVAGTIESQVQVDLGFRIGGRLAERLVSVGDVVTAGQALAKLDPADEENGLRSAEANVAAAQAQLTEAQENFNRQRQLYDRGFLARAGLDRAEAQLTSATSAADAARAQLGIAKRRLNDTMLYADAPGTVTVIGAEPGEVVQPGRMVVQIARDDGKDAVIDVPAGIVGDANALELAITVALSQNPAVTAQGRIREVAPRADAVTGTFRVRIGLIDPPSEMRLGSAISASTTLDAIGSIEIPAAALTSDAGKPAVWVVDPATNAVALRPISVDRFTPSAVVVLEGLAPGDIVVTGGVQALRPGQEVRLMGAAS